MGKYVLHYKDYIQTISSDLHDILYEVEKDDSIFIYFSSPNNFIPTCFFNPWDLQWDRNEGRYDRLAVELSSTLSEIDMYSFTYSEIWNITLPNSLVSIGFACFQNCKKLSKVTFQEKPFLKTIREFAFDGCTNLSEIEIPEGVETLEENSFCGTGLKDFNSIILPNSLIRICDECFKDTAICPNWMYSAHDLEQKDNITKKKNIETFKSLTKDKDYVLLGKQNQIYFYCCNKALKKIEIPNHVKVIASNAFQNRDNRTYTWNSLDYRRVENGHYSVEEIIIPEGVVSIGTNAFYYYYYDNKSDDKEHRFIDSGGCKYLKTVNIPTTVNYIGSEIFSLSKILNPSENHHPDVCDPNKNNKLLVENNLIYYIDDGGNYCLLSIEYPDLYYTEEFITLSNKTRVIAEGAAQIWEDESLSGITKTIIVKNDDNIKRDLYIGRRAFMDSLYLYDISQLFEKFNVKEIGEEAFSFSYFTKDDPRPRLIINFDFPEGLKIKENAFSNITFLNVDEGDSYVDPFENPLGYDRREVITINSILPPGSTASGCFWGRYIHTVNLGKHAKTMPGCLSGLSGENLNINCEEIIDGHIGNGAFSKCKFPNILVGVDSGVSSIKKIGIYTFYRNEYVENIRFKNNFNITSIPTGMFYQCTNLKNITFENTTIKEINSYAFYGCTGLNSFIIPEGITTIKEGTFSESGLESITIPENVKIIEKEAFKGCTNIKSITIPSGITVISERLFCNCTGLSSIEIPGNVTIIEKEAFCGCTGLTTIYIPKSVNRINSDAFKGCTKLTNIFIEGEETWFKIIFENELSNPLSNGGTLFLNGKEISNLTPEIIPITITTLKKYSFSSYSKLKTISLPDNISNLEEKVFFNCNNLTKVTISSTTKLNKLSDSLFNNCKNLIEVVFSNTTIPNIRIIGNQTFYNCDKLILNNSLKNLLNTSIIYVGFDAFKNCSNLGNDQIESNILEFNKDLKEISFGAFSNTGIKYVSLEKNYYLGEISESLFNNCTSLETLLFPPNIRKIKPQAFYNCNKLKINNISFPETLISIGKKAFYNCSSLTGMISFKGTDIALEDNCFENCNNVSSFNNLNYIKDIGRDVFKNTGWYNNLSNGIIKINNGIYDYKGTVSGTELDLSGDTTITYIHGHAFENKITDNGQLSNITTVKLPKYLQTIGNSAFEGCNKLIKIFWEEKEGDLRKIQNIGNSAFCYCSSLNKIILSTTTYSELPEIRYNKNTGKYYNTREISTFSEISFLGSYAFYGCSSLKGYTTIIKNTGLIETGNNKNPFEKNEDGSYKYTKTETTEVERLDLWDSLEEIPSGTFCWCKKLKVSTGERDFTIINNNSRLTKIGKNSLSEGVILDINNEYFNFLNLPKLTTIDTDAFKSANFITNSYGIIDLSPSIKKIGDNAFSEISNKTFRFLKFKEIPEVGENSFMANSDYNVTTLQVPDTLYSNWSNNFNWFDYKNLIVSENIISTEGDKIQYGFEKTINYTGGYYYSDQRYKDDPDGENNCTIYDFLTESLYPKSEVLDIIKDADYQIANFCAMRIYKLGPDEKINIDYKGTIWPHVKYIIFEESWVDTNIIEGYATNTPIFKKGPGINPDLTGIQLIPPPENCKYFTLYSRKPDSSSSRGNGCTDTDID